MTSCGKPVLAVTNEGMFVCLSAVIMLLCLIHSSFSIFEFVTDSTNTITHDINKWRMKNEKCSSVPTSNQYQQAGDTFIHQIDASWPQEAIDLYILNKQQIWTNKPTNKNVISRRIDTRARGIHINPLGYDPWGYCRNDVPLVHIPLRDQHLCHRHMYSRWLHSLEKNLCVLLPKGRWRRWHE